MLHADSFISTMTHDLVQFRDDKAAVLVILHMFMFCPAPYVLLIVSKKETL